jgi:signal transduction histidine kinase
VDGALDFARSGATAAGGQRSDLRAAIDGAIDEVHADESGTEVVIEPFADVSLACAPGVLASVLSNLVRNAAKYMEGRDVRRITIRAKEHDALVRVEVEDTGPGLPAGFEREVFEPYVRAPDAKPGLGLGLATVRRFVEAHRGHVGVESVVGKGCVFWFELPVKRAPSIAPGHEVASRTA